MKVLNGSLNPEIKDPLYDFSDWFFQQDRSAIKLEGEREADDLEYYTSKEYLDLVNVESHEGFPEKAYGVDLALSYKMPFEFKEKLRELDSALISFFACKFNAVKMYYPEGGYMGWHNNWNCPGFNILLSYTQNGCGFFRYQDPETKEIVTLDDLPGWTVKVGYYGSYEEHDKIYWHCARAYEERLTLGYVIPNKDMWELAIEDMIV